MRALLIARFPMLAEQYRLALCNVSRTARFPSFLPFAPHPLPDYNARMAKYLLVVESPAKATTIAHYLGKDYAVLASVGPCARPAGQRAGRGHRAGLSPVLQVTAGQGQGRGRDPPGSATRPRPSIWPPTSTARARPSPGMWWPPPTSTPPAPSASPLTRSPRPPSWRRSSIPRDLDMHLIDAQQARRVLDRLVGYQISPVLSKALHRGATGRSRRGACNRWRCG